MLESLGHKCRLRSLANSLGTARIVLVHRYRTSDGDTPAQRIEYSPLAEQFIFVLRRISIPTHTTISASAARALIAVLAMVFSSCSPLPTVPALLEPHGVLFTFLLPLTGVGSSTGSSTGFQTYNAAM